MWCRWCSTLPCMHALIYEMWWIAKRYRKIWYYKTEIIICGNSRMLNFIIMWNCYVRAGVYIVVSMHNIFSPVVLCLITSTVYLNIISIKSEILSSFELTLLTSCNNDDVCSLNLCLFFFLNYVFELLLCHKKMLWV